MTLTYVINDANTWVIVCSISKKAEEVAKVGTLLADV